MFAFSSCEDITDVYLDNGVTSVLNSAFGYCPKLYSIYIGDTVT